MSLFEPGKKRRPPIAAGLVLLLLAGTVVFVLLRAGRFGASW